MALTTQQRAGLHSSASAEWYTPPDLLAEVLAFLGPGTYDPCPPHTPRARLENGLALTWGVQTAGKAFVNPPYGRTIGRWVGKALGDPLHECILLVPARTETSWFQPLYAHAILFLRGRLRFSGADWNAPFPSVLCYRGPHVGQFAQAFAHRGTTMTWVPARAQRMDLWSLASAEEVGA